MPIGLAPIDTELTIIKILADEKTRRHLESLGVVAKGKITVISSNGGNAICVIQDVIRNNFDVAKVNCHSNKKAR